MATAAAATATTSEFDNIIKATPIYALTEQGKGFLPPLLRGYGHIIFLASWQAESASKRPTDEQVAEELRLGREHANNVNPSLLSTASQEVMKKVTEAWKAAEKEFSGWSASQREANFTALANLLLHSLVRLDRELVGLRDSDIGTTL